MVSNWTLGQVDTVPINFRRWLMVGAEFIKFETLIILFRLRSIPVIHLFIVPFTLQPLVLMQVAHPLERTPWLIITIGTFWPHVLLIIGATGAVLPGVITSRLIFLVTSL